MASDKVYWKHSDKQFLSLKDTNEFMNFAAKNNKHYAEPKDLEKRLKIWKWNHDVVKGMNALRMDATFEDNFTSDMTDEEFSMMQGLVPSLAQEAAEAAPLESESAENDEDHHGRMLASSSINWVNKGKVRNAEHQGQCGTCWIFAGATALESAKAIKDGTEPKRLSE